MLLQSRGPNAAVVTTDTAMYNTNHVFTGFLNPAWPIKSCWSPDGRYIASGAEDGKLLYTTFVDCS